MCAVSARATQAVVTARIKLVLHENIVTPSCNTKYDHERTLDARYNLLDTRSCKWFTLKLLLAVTQLHIDEVQAYAFLPQSSYFSIGSVRSNTQTIDNLIHARYNLGSALTGRLHPAARESSHLF